MGKSFFSLDKHSLLDKFEENVVDSCMSEFVNENWDKGQTLSEFIVEEQAAQAVCEKIASQMRDTLNMTLRDK